MARGTTSIHRVGAPFSRETFRGSVSPRPVTSVGAAMLTRQDAWERLHARSGHLVGPSMLPRPAAGGPAVSSARSRRRRSQRPLRVLNTAGRQRQRADRNQRLAVPHRSGRYTTAPFLSALVVASRVAPVSSVIEHHRAHPAGALGGGGCGSWCESMDSVPSVVCKHVFDTPVSTKVDGIQ